MFRFASSGGAPTLPNFSLARASFDPGSTTDGHYHAVSEEAYLVESGSADILVWDPKDANAERKTYHVVAGSCLAIPRGMAHRVFADPTEGLVCVIVASPPFSFWDQFFPTQPA
ncbi:MAG: cupin domain-containing protein [Nitrosopumilaceae archaeon]|nr:cupin domain-containing protein [Nitrosopumilaceae archaeon]